MTATNYYETDRRRFPQTFGNAPIKLRSMQIHKKIYKDWPLTIQPFLLILTFILISMSCLAQDECYSRLDKDTLTIGNQYIERKFIWNKGNIITYSLSDKKGKRVWFNRNKKPDFSVPADDGARNANYLLFSRKADAVKFAAQETIVSFFYRWP